MIQHHHIGEEPIALDARALGDYWPGIQLYYPPVKYAQVWVYTRIWTKRQRA